MLLALLAVTAGCGRLGYGLLAVDAGRAEAPTDAAGSDGAGDGAGGRDAAGGAGGADAGLADEPASDAPASDAPVTCTAQTYGSHDYLFCETLVSWPTALAECRARGMRLIRLDDAAESAWAQATAAFGSRRLGMWIGAYEPGGVDGDWHWSDGTPLWSGDASGMAVGGLYTNWARGEPNNVSGNESCAVMQLNPDDTWFDYQCTTTEAHFACEAY